MKCFIALIYAMNHVFKKQDKNPATFSLNVDVW